MSAGEFAEAGGATATAAWAATRPVVVAARDAVHLAVVRELRRRVFGEEQGIADGFADADDARSLHALVFLPAAPDDPAAARVAVATARLTMGFGERGEALIAWVATLPGYRGRGAAAAALRFLLAAADGAGAPTVVLAAQTHALGFYRRFGFQPYGTRYRVQGIEHQWMARPGRGNAAGW